MESWVDIKKGNLSIRVPYQAYLDVFEGNGFEIIDKSLNAEPTFSHLSNATETKEIKVGIDTKRLPKEVASARKTIVQKRPNQTKNIK